MPSHRRIQKIHQFKARAFRHSNSPKQHTAASQRRFSHHSSLCLHPECVFFIVDNQHVHSFIPSNASFSHFVYFLLPSLCHNLFKPQILLLNASPFL